MTSRREESSYFAVDSSSNDGRIAQAPARATMGYVKHLDASMNASFSLSVKANKSWPSFFSYIVNQSH